MAGFKFQKANLPIKFCQTDWDLGFQFQMVRIQDLSLVLQGPTTGMNTQSIQRTENLTPAPVLMAGYSRLYMYFIVFPNVV